ncbi:MAG: ribulose-phosphate 3-epimerase [Phycisphaerales bacterium]|nr:ribulose-phosphate 3-epimerase [Phycisphaerales bacterium]
MGEDCAGVLAAGADLLHLDVMDGHFVPNLTMGPDMARGLRAALPNAFLDVHLMVADPARYVESFARAGANHLTFHIEAVPGMAALQLAEGIRAKGMTAGIAINPPTPMEAVREVAAKFDLVLVMSVNPGFSGQAFIEETLDKTRRAREWVPGHVRIQMDGGISPTNADRVRSAGCDVLVAASAIFKKPPAARQGVIAQLRGDE